jgi:hypothetical protein
MLGVFFTSESRGWEQDQWSWVFTNFGITDIWERNKLDDRDTKIYQESVAVDTTADLPDFPLVVMSPPDARFIPGTISLADFDHPDDCIYLFGANHDVLSDIYLGDREPDHAVYIQTVKGEMYSHAAAYVTLWDRYVKRGDFG